MTGVSPHLGKTDIRSFNRAELRAMITTAHTAGVKIAAHAQSNASIPDLLALRVNSIEHAPYLHPSSDADPDPSPTTVLDAFARSDTIWVPTLSVFYKASRTPGREYLWESASRSFKRALELGMENIAAGGDTGAFAHGENALEMKLMVRLGADWRRVLRWGTLSGWQLIRPMDWENSVGVPPQELGDNDMQFGCVSPGWAADIVGVEGDFAKDFDATIDAVKFVMKAGRVYKLNGKEMQI